MVVDENLKDVWLGARVIEAVYGFNLGLMQFTYQVFLYEHFGANPVALKITVGIFLLTSLGILLLEIPTGAWGDYAGRKRTLIACFVTAALTYFLRSWVFFIDSLFMSALVAGLAALIYALSYTLFSGTFTAWVVDAVRERSSKTDHGQILAGVYGYMMGGKIIGAIFGLWFYLSGVVFYASGLASVISLLCALFIAVFLPETHSYVDNAQRKLNQIGIRRMWDIIVVGWNIALRNIPVRCMIFMGASYMVVIHLVCALWPIAMKENFGIVRMTWSWYVVVFSGMCSAYLGAHYLAQQMKRSQSLPPNLRTQVVWRWFAGVCLLMSSGILALGYCKLRGGMTLPIFLAVFVVFNFAYGFLMPASGTLLNIFIPEENSNERATINSLGPMLAEILLLIVAFPSSGSSGENTVVGWMLPAGILFVLTCVIHFRMRRYLRLPVASVPVEG